MKRNCLRLVVSLLLSVAAFPTLANKIVPTSAFFDAAFCKPSYSTRHFMKLYEAAEKLSKADKSSGAAVFHLSSPIKRDGFFAHDVVFFGSTIGVLVQGNVAEKLAKQYNLTPEEINITGMTGYTRQLPDDQQNLKEIGLIYIVALISDEFKGKTLLGCQFVSNEDRKNMELLNTDQI